MRSLDIRGFSTAVFIILAGLIGRAEAAVIDDIARDFKPIAGVVVAVEGQEVIIDLAEASGIRRGDIVSVLAPGKPIVHPVTQAVLGTLENVKAVLKVVRPGAKFSIARPLGSVESIHRGDAVRTYDRLPAVFWDYATDGRTVYRQLQAALPDLKWQDYESAQRSKPENAAESGGTAGALIFIHTVSGLEVRDPEHGTLRAYPSPAADRLISAAPAATTAARPKPAEASGPAGRIEPVFSRSETLANLPDVSIMSDFFRSNQRLMMASTDGLGIVVYDMTGGLVRLASAKLPRQGTLLALKWWQPTADGSVYIAVTAWIDNGVSSSLWELHGDALKLVLSGIPRIIGAFDTDLDGRPETLLAQEFDRDPFFGQRIQAAALSDGNLHYSEPQVELPRQFSVLGSAIADLTGDGRPEAIFIRNQILFVYSGSRQLYKSPKEMGGSLSVLTYNRGPSSINPEPATAVAEVSPVCVDLDRNGHPEILAPASERTLVGSLVPSVPDVKRSWIAVTRFQNGRFESGTLGDKMDMPVQGLGINDGQLLVVATAGGSIAAERDGKSHILTFGLAH